MNRDLTPPIVLKASLRKMLALTSVSLVFVAMGFFIREREPLTAYFGMAFFGLCALVGAVNLHPRSSYLEVTKDGFAFASLFRRHFVRWEHVIQFQPLSIGGNGMVGWNYTSSFTGSPGGRKISSAIADVEAALPDTYGMSAAELASALNKVLESSRGGA